MEEEKEICRHCKREVIKKSLVLHEVHCERHITLCPDCKEPVKKDELESHKNEAHALVPCRDCKKSVEKHALESHKMDDCLSRLIPCEYCEVDCKASNVEAHQETCGSRTDECHICGTIVLIHMFKIHMALHEKKMTPVTNSETFPNAAFSSKPAVPSHSTVKTRSTTIQNMLASSQISEREPPQAADHFEALDDWLPSENASGVSESETPFNDLPKVACEICNIEVSMFEINEHERQCGQYLENYMENDPAVNMRDELVKDEDEDALWSQRETRYVERSVRTEEPWTAQSNEAAIPCEICGELFPRDCLELHQIACKFTEATISSPPSLEPVAEPEPGPSSFDFTDSELPAEIPCEFCGALISVKILDLHEVGCQKDRVHRESLKNRSANYPDNTFSRIFDGAQTDVKRPVKPKPINNRIENPLQRNMRETALKATENRKETNPQKAIRQSAYTHIRLPDGTELLKKNHLASNNEAVDVGHILGRAERYESPDFVQDALAARPFNREVQRSPATPAKAARIEAQPSSLTKKPNTSFKHYAFQHDPGHVLGGRSNQERPRSQDPFHGRHIPRDDEDTEIPRERTEQPRPVLRNGDANEYKGARPKRPAYR